MQHLINNPHTKRIKDDIKEFETIKSKLDSIRLPTEPEPDVYKEVNLFILKNKNY